MRTKLLRIAVIIIASLAGLILIAFVTYVILYYPRKVEPFEISGSNQSKNILIATQGSDFKNLLVQTLTDSLEISEVNVKGINVKDLSDVDEDAWDKILIINSFIVQLNRHVEQFTHNTNTPEKILLMVTSGGADWQPNHDLKVDAITSASRSAHIKSLLPLITDWISNEELKWEPIDFALALYYFPGIDTKVACDSIFMQKERYLISYPNLVSLINGAGYQYLRVNDTRAALEVFKLNIRLFPENWNVYDSYGEALLANGDKKSAIRSYEKALDLNPESVSAAEMLKKLR